MGLGMRATDRLQSESIARLTNTLWVFGFAWDLWTHWLVLMQMVLLL